jgi:hypothetical protein
MLRACALTIALGVFVPCHAENTVIGPGAMSCAKLGELYKQNATSAERYATLWAQGFLSGINDAHVKAGEPARALDGLIEGDTLMSYLRQACDGRPMAPFFGITSDFYETLSKTKAR